MKAVPMAREVNRTGPREREVSGIGQDGHKRDHGHDRQVLEDQDPERDAAVRSVRLAPVGQDLQDDGRAAQGDKEAVEHGLPQGET
jgi:hypothetical protein